jgi:hypothetical protein
MAAEAVEKSEKVVSVPIDLSSRQGRAQAEKVLDGGDWEDYNNSEALSEYLKSGTEPLARYRDALLFSVESDSSWNPDLTAALSNGVLGRIFGVVPLDVTAEHLKGSKQAAPLGAIVPCEKRTQENKQYKHLVVVNGDEEHNQLVSLLDNGLFPTVSFECLAHFYPESKRGEYEVGVRLATGELRVVDYQPDQVREMSKEDKKVWATFRSVTSPSRLGNKSTKVKPPAPPEPGFTAVGNEWHRSATVLLHDTKRNMTLLIGQDEGTYFGVELPRRSGSISEAFKDLTPDGARGVAGVKRQGEWFAVPVDLKDVPTLSESIVTSESDLTLPMETDDSNRHYVRSMDIRVAKDGTVYALDPQVEHSAGEHAEMNASGWVKFLKNTAKRSFSVEGVD